MQKGDTGCLLHISICTFITLTAKCNIFVFSVSLRWRLLPIPAKRHHPLPASGTPTMPYQRYGHSAVAYGDCAYIWGGRNDTDGACNVLFVFNTGKIGFEIQIQVQKPNFFYSVRLKIFSPVALLYTFQNFSKARIEFSYIIMTKEEVGALITGNTS